MTVELQTVRPAEVGPPRTYTAPVGYDDPSDEDGIKENAQDKVRRHTARGSNWAKSKLAGSATTRSKRTVQVDAPVRTVDGCLFYGEDGYWYASFQLETVPMYSNMPPALKLGSMLRVANLLRNLEGKSGVLRVTSDELDAEAMRDIWYRESILDADDVESQTILRDKIEYDTDALVDQRYQLRAFSIEIQLSDRTLRGSVDGWDKNKEASYRYGQTAFGINHPKNHRLVDLVHEVYELVRGDFKDATPMTQTEVLHLINRSIWRGLPSPPPIVFPSDRPITRANELCYIGEANILDLNYELEIDCLGDVGYVSMLSLAVLPKDGVRLPGLEFLWLGDDIGDPLDIIIHFDVVPPEKIVQEMEGQRAKIEDYAEALFKKNGDAGQPEIEETKAHIKRFTDYATSNHPGVHYTVTAAVPGKTRDQVKRVRRGIIRAATNVDSDGDAIHWTAPYALQTQLYLKCQPGSSVRPDRYWHDAEPHAIAAGAPFATDIPSVVGAWMGQLTGRDRGPLFISLESVLTEQIDSGTVTTVLGPPGSGKTTLTIELCMNQARKGTLVFFREGMKGDTLQLELEQVPFAPRTHVVDISTEPGCFNPGLFGKNTSEQAHSLTDFLVNNAPSWQPQWREGLFKFAFNEIDEHPNDPDFRRVVDALSNDPKYDMFNDSWSQLQHLPQANVSYGTREQFERLANRLQSGLNIWRNVEWRLPDPDKDPVAWTAIERFSVSALSLQFGFSRTVALVRDRRTLTADDEFHEKANVSGGISDVALHGRWGRSKGAMYLFATHSGSATDIPEQIKQYSTHVIAFRPGNTTEAALYARMLQFPNPDDPQVIHDLMNLGCDPDSGLPTLALKGEAFIRNPLGQIARGQFTRREVGTAFRTTFTPSAQLVVKG